MQHARERESERKKRSPGVLLSQGHAEERRACLWAVFPVKNTVQSCTRSKTKVDCFSLGRGFQGEA